MSTQHEQQDWLNLSRRVAVVTGAGSGIGAAIANGFAKSISGNGRDAPEAAVYLPRIVAR